MHALITANPLLERGGMPDSLRAAWMGHSVEVNRSTYLAAAADLAPVGKAMGRLIGKRL